MYGARCWHAPQVAGLHPDSPCSSFDRGRDRPVPHLDSVQHQQHEQGNSSHARQQVHCPALLATVHQGPRWASARRHVTGRLHHRWAAGRRRSARRRGVGVGRGAPRGCTWSPQQCCRWLRAWPRQAVEVASTRRWPNPRAHLAAKLRRIRTSHGRNVQSKNAFGHPATTPPVQGRGRDHPTLGGPNPHCMVWSAHGPAEDCADHTYKSPRPVHPANPMASTAQCTYAAAATAALALTRDLGCIARASSTIMPLPHHPACKYTAQRALVSLMLQHGMQPSSRRHPPSANEVAVMPAGPTGLLAVLISQFDHKGLLQPSIQPKERQARPNRS